MAKDHFEDSSCPPQPQSRDAHKLDLVNAVMPSVAIKNHGELVSSLAEIDDVSIPAASGTVLVRKIKKYLLDLVGEQNEFVDAAGHFILHSRATVVWLSKENRKRRE